jgi:hypothetical protein
VRCVLLLSGLRLGLCDEEDAVKIKIYVIDFGIPVRVKAWGLRIGILALVLGTAAIAIAAGPLHVWANGNTLQATDLNGNFTGLDGRVTALENQERIQRVQLGSDGTISLRPALGSRW